ncbi:unnamed protein product [Adineta ricciae]|uniref:Uncharacterized protein n=1 Tax=Adineta ricciae TaxID=249248 RepID=A0A814DWX6_ADIRI|nr:unnamed protein product [Adineta ricciae]
MKVDFLCFSDTIKTEEPCLFCLQSQFHYYKRILTYDNNRISAPDDFGVLFSKMLCLYESTFAERLREQRTVQNYLHPFYGTFDEVMKNVLSTARNISNW